jgi:hypothetical protein
MAYTIFRCSTGEPLDTLSMHVLARDYRTAWRALYFCNPVGRHVIEGLDVLIEFRQPPAAPGNCASDDSDMT